MKTCTEATFTEWLECICLDYSIWKHVLRSGKTRNNKETTGDTNLLVVVDIKI